MIRLRSLFPLVLALVPLAVGCKKDEPEAAKPDQNAANSAAAVSSKNRPQIRGPLAPMPKIEPQAMKDYRLAVCYFGTLTLRQARDAYLGSLGKDEPSEKKIPVFGSVNAPPATIAGPVKPQGSASAGPRPSAAPVPVPLTAPSGSAMAGRRIVDLGLRAPHERNARACTVALGLKDPAMPDVDAALAEFAPYALALSRKISEASVYYQREEYKKDKFEKGKTLHKELVAEFAKLDGLSDKLGAAIDAFQKGHPADPGKLDEGEKLVIATYDKARELLLSVLVKKIDVAAYKTNLAALEKSIEGLKAFGTANANDSWAKITAPSFDAVLKATKDAEAKISDKGIDQDAFLMMVNSFTALIEARHRALSRALIAKGQTIEPNAGGVNLPARPRIPMPGKPGEPGRQEPPSRPEEQH